MRTRLAILKVNPEGMNRKQMEEEYTKAVVEAGRGTGQMARVIHTFSGNIMTTDIIAPDGTRKTMSSDPFTVDGTAINWSEYSYPCILQDNTLTLDIKGRKMIFHKVE